MAANPRSTPRVPPAVPKRAHATQLSTAHPVSSVSGEPSAVTLRPLHQAHGEAAAVGQPVVPKRAPATQLSMAHPISSVSGGPSAVMLRPLHHAHGEAAAVGQPIEYISYVQGTTESEAGQIETPEQRLIDPALIAETKSNDKAQKPDNIHSVFDITDKDVKAFTPAENSWEDEEPELRIQRARNYKNWIKILCFLSILTCMWPATGLCLCVAHFTSNKTTRRNDEKDYDSAHGCRKVTKAFIILGVIFLIITPIIIIVASVCAEFCK